MSDVCYSDTVCIGIILIYVLTGSSVTTGGCASSKPSTSFSQCRSETPLQGSASEFMTGCSVSTDDGAQVETRASGRAEGSPPPLVSQEFLAALSVGGKRPSTVDICPSAAKKAAIIAESGRKRIG
jgi:hypothetical protein